MFYNKIIINKNWRYYLKFGARAVISNQYDKVKGAPIEKSDRKGSGSVVADGQ